MAVTEPVYSFGDVDRVVQRLLSMQDAIHANDWPMTTVNELKLDRAMSAQLLYLAQSTIPGAGLGVFARTTLPANAFLGTYSGKLYLAALHGKAGSADPDEAYQGDGNYALRVVAQDMSLYTIDGDPRDPTNPVTLISRINHGNTPDARNVVFDGVRAKTTRQVLAHEELFVDYNVDTYGPLPVQELALVDFLTSSTFPDDGTGQSEAPVIATVCAAAPLPDGTEPVGIMICTPSEFSDRKLYVPVVFHAAELARAAPHLGLTSDVDVDMFTARNTVPVVPCHGVADYGESQLQWPGVPVLDTTAGPGAWKAYRSLQEYSSALLGDDCVLPVYRQPGFSGPATSRTFAAAWTLRQPEFCAPWVWAPMPVVPVNRGGGVSKSGTSFLPLASIVDVYGYMGLTTAIIGQGPVIMERPLPRVMHDLAGYKLQQGASVAFCSAGALFRTQSSESLSKWMHFMVVNPATASSMAKEWYAKFVDPLPANVHRFEGEPWLSVKAKDNKRYYDASPKWLPPTGDSDHGLIAVPASQVQASTYHPLRLPYTDNPLSETFAAALQCLLAMSELRRFGMDIDIDTRNRADVTEAFLSAVFPVFRQAKKNPAGAGATASASASASASGSAAGAGAGAGLVSASTSTSLDAGEFTATRLFSSPLLPSAARPNRGLGLGLGLGLGAGLGLPLPQPVMPPTRDLINPVRK